MLSLVEQWCLLILSTWILLPSWVLAHLNILLLLKNLSILILYTSFTLIWHFKIISRVLGKDINISLDHFAHLLHLSCEGVDIYNVDLHEFDYLDSESALTTFLLLHDDEYPALVRNEEVKYYTLIAQVLTKIVFYNLLQKSEEYSHAQGSAPLLIYCLLKGIRVNILKLIVDYMAS